MEVMKEDKIRGVWQMVNQVREFVVQVQRFEVKFFRLYE